MLFLEQHLHFVKVEELLGMEKYTSGGAMKDTHNKLLKLTSVPSALFVVGTTKSANCTPAA